MLPFRISASVTRSRVVSAWLPISRFAFDSFFLFFFFLLSSFCLMPRQWSLFLHRPIFGCANTAHCRGARALTVLHLASLSQGWLGLERTLFSLCLAFSLTLFVFCHRRFTPLAPYERDLNMQSDFFLRRVGFFPCLVRRAHIITGWRENNGQKTACAE